MKVYLDSSVVLRRLLAQPGAIHDWSRWEYICSSELLRVETYRTLHRLHLRRILTDAEMSMALNSLQKYLASFELVPITTAVLQRSAGVFPTVLGALDAIHLATALHWSDFRGEPIAVITYDRELSIAARACGLEVQP